MPTQSPVICPVETKAQMRAFIRLPWQIYAGDHNWVAPLIHDQKQFLNQAKNPFFEHAEARCFLAYADNKPVGRIGVAINHTYNDYWSERAGFFGFFEFPGLLDITIEFSRANGQS